VLPKQPAAILLFGVMLYVTPVLMNDQVFAKTLDCPVKFELLATIIAFGRGRQNFDDQQRIDNAVLLVAGKLQVAANNAAVRVSIESSRSNLDPQIGVEDAALGRYLAVEKRANAVGEQRVIRRAACHGKHLSVMELALGLSQALDLQVLLLGK